MIHIPLIRANLQWGLALGGYRYGIPLNCRKKTAQLIPQQVLVEQANLVLGMTVASSCFGADQSQLCRSLRMLKLGEQQKHGSRYIHVVSTGGMGWDTVERVVSCK